MFQKKSIGMFLGQQGVNIVETTGVGKVKNYIYNPYPKDITRPGGAVVAKNNIFDAFLDNEVEIIAFLQKTIRESRVNIEKDEIIVCVPNRDLIVRFFEMPRIPEKDISASVGFEIKKYIPFKTEEITYDYQSRSQKNTIEILFAGIKNENLQKYKSILTQLNANISVIEPSQFSLLRLLKIKKVINNKEAVLIIELEREEGVISIVDGGIPTFSRDIKIASAPEAAETDTETVSFRIINEVRVSIDYFRRQFLKKGIERIVILSKEESKELINTFNKELGIPVFYKNPDDIFGIKEEHSLHLAKALGASFRVSKPSSLVINLGKKEKTAAGMWGEVLEFPRETLINGLSFALVALIAIFIWSIFNAKPIYQEFYSVSKEADSRLSQEMKGMALEEVLSRKEDLSNRLAVYRAVFYKDFFISEKLEVLNSIMPEGVWLEDISFDRDNRILYFRGLVYREDDKEAAEVPYSFISNLKNSPLFFNKVRDISVKSLRSDIQNNFKVVRFEIDVRLEF